MNTCTKGAISRPCKRKNIPDSFSHQLGANSLLPVSSIDFAKISRRALLQDRERQRGDVRVILYSMTMLLWSGWILQWWSTEQYHDMNMRQQHWRRPLPLQDSRVHRTTPICCLQCKTQFWTHQSTQDAYSKRMLAWVLRTA